MEVERSAFLLLLRVMMKKGMNWMGFGNKTDCGGLKCVGEDMQHPGDDVVLDHIILDMTGKSVPLEHIADASIQRAYKKKKRLLLQSNTVLFSRLGIMALVAIMLMVTTLLAWYFTSTYSARSVKSLASDLRQQLMRSSVQAMVSILGEVYNATLILGSLHQQVYAASSNSSWDAVEPQLRQVNRGVFNSQHQYSSVAFVSQDGRLTDYSRSKIGSYWFFVNVTSSQSQTPTWYFQNLTGFSNDSQAPPPTVRDPPYPLSAAALLSIKPEEMYWTIAANIWGEAVVSPAVPVQQTNKLLGLATTTSTFTQLNTYLASVDLLGGFLYFDWHNGTNESAMVAFSYNASSDSLSSPLNASNPVVRAAAGFLTSEYGYTFLTETHNENIELVGQEYYIDTLALLQQPYSNLNLTAVLIVPRKSIMGRIDQRNRTVVRVSVGTTVGVLVLGCCLICFLTSKMSTEMQLRQELIRVLVGKHRAEQSSNYKSQFLANMSHELRTPIAAIMGLLDLLSCDSCDSLTPDQESSVSQIRSCATGLLALVNNVLDISKVEAGRMELEVAPFSLGDELESLVDMFAIQSVGSNIDVVLDLSDDIPSVVKGDVTRIRQIFSNLLSNSVKFTTQGHVLVRGWVDQSLLEQNEKQTDFNLSILSRRERVSGPLFSGPLFLGAENQLALVFEVHDTGCGIPVELHETVFDSFVQADSSTTRTYGGSGLGLYLVRSLVELMGGEVAVVPIEGPGTLMRFHIIVERARNPLLGGMGRPGEGPAGLSSSSDPDWLNFGLGSPSFPFEPVKRALPKALEKSQVLVAKQEGVAQKVATKWLQKFRLKVTSVEIWEDIIPSLEAILRNNATELKSSKDAGSDVSGTGMCSLHSQNHVESPQSSRRVSENVAFPSVLALVDVTMHPCMEKGFRSRFVEPSVIDSTVHTSSYNCDPQKLPPHMQDLLDCMVRIHDQHSVAVGWIVPPYCGSRWKQALQADGRFVVMKKPLSVSRMRLLVALLSNTGKFEQHHWGVHSSQSSSPSTPRLTGPCGPNSDEGDFRSHIEEASREHFGPNLGTPSDSTFPTAPASSDEEALCSVSEKQVRDSSDSKCFFPIDQQHDRTVSQGRESGVQPLSHKVERVPKTNCEDSLATSCPYPPENSKRAKLGQPSDSLQLRTISSDVTPTTTNLPTTDKVAQKHRQKVLPVVIPYNTDGSQMLLGENVPQSSTNGCQISPEGAAASELIKCDREYSSKANTVQEMERNRIDVRGHLEQEWSRPVVDLRLSEKALQRHNEASSGPSKIDAENQFSHVEPFAIPPPVRTISGQALERHNGASNAPSKIDAENQPTHEEPFVVPPPVRKIVGQALVRRNGASNGPSKVDAEDQPSHKEPLAVPPPVRKITRQPRFCADTKTVAQSGHENLDSVPDCSAASNSVIAYGNRVLSSMHILLVEDTLVLQRLASMMLKKLGANVTVVGDGQQAVVAVAESVEASQSAASPILGYTSRFDLILMDCAMPVMDGYSATKAIRVAEENTNRHIPIVALTAHALASDEERCLSVGMDAYLTKPINCQRMVATIKDVVSKGRG